MIIKGQATVVKHTGSHYLLSQLPEWNLFPAVLRGKIRLKGSTATNPVAVGDVVNFEAEAESLVLLLSYYILIEACKYNQFKTFPLL